LTERNFQRKRLTNILYFILQAPWNEDFLRDGENFSEGNHDDVVDALSDAFLMLTDLTCDLTALTTL